MMLKIKKRLSGAVSYIRVTTDARHTDFMFYNFNREYMWHNHVKFQQNYGHWSFRVWRFKVESWPRNPAFES